MFASALFICVQLVSAKHNVIGDVLDANELLDVSSHVIIQDLDISDIWYEELVERFPKFVCSTFATEEHDAVDIVRSTFLVCGTRDLALDLADDVCRLHHVWSYRSATE